MQSCAEIGCKNLHIAAESWSNYTRTKSAESAIFPAFFVVSLLFALTIRDQEVAGSNPVTPTAIIT
jgi:hypothetical protein